MGWRVEWSGVKCGRHLFRGAIKTNGNYDALSAIAASGPIPAIRGGTEQCQPEQIVRDGIVFYNGSAQRKTLSNWGTDRQKTEMTKRQTDRETER